MTVWLLKHGSYGEYDIIGIFSSRAGAEAARAERIGDPESDPDMDIIEEHEVKWSGTTDPLEARLRALEDRICALERWQDAEHTSMLERVERGE
jgi:hypothetical protein